MSEDKNNDAIVTMCLTGYRDTIKKLTYALIALAICWLCTVGGFLYYLAGYEVQVENYGGFENSKVNTSTGQFNEKVDNFTVNNNGVDVNGENKK
ncbi:MAG: hypothetical protein DBY32_04180 [Phascolarctobacterium sp.]|nr:MAG: hypothetical protein DBY32_04180 [Phascolarctobacterium sp.]